METSSHSRELIVSGQYLMPTWRQKDVIIDGAIAVSGDTIVETGSRNDLLSRFPDAREIYEPHGLIMPGLINTHTHAPMACFRGFADDLPLMTWLQDHIFPVEAQLTSDIVYDSTLLSIIEMIKSGTTSFCDMYLFAKGVAEAAEKSGIRCWVGEVLYDFPSPSYGELQDGFKYVEEMFATYKNHPLVSVTVDPHSVYTCSPSLLKQCHQLAEKHGSLYVIHLSESHDEVTNCRQQYGTSPVRHLENLGVLNNRTLAAHCVKLDSEEISLLAQRQVHVSHCAESNMKLASGIAPVPKLLEQGVLVSIGTDGSASNNDVDMFSEMNSVAKIHKAILMDPTTMDAETTLHAATLGGAAALNAATRIGTLTAGKKADLIVLDHKQPHLIPIYNIPSHPVYAVRGADVIHSIINGRIIMEHRVIKTVDETTIIARMQEIGRKIVALREAKATA
jgi:5-methylthioadenosine/S-adenosylhomocysteine deaminase